MGGVSELFWNASVEEMKRGYVYQEASEMYACMICGERFERGVIYPQDGVLYEAEKFARLHVEREHTSMFAYLIGLDKKTTGLTDLQKSLLTYFHQGLSDREIVEQMDGGSTSTIRNHRFTLREKEKQAKVLLAIMGLLEEQEHAQGKQKTTSAQRVVSRTDQPFVITEAELGDILQTYFKEGLDGPLSEFPKKEKRRVAILRHLITRFDPEKKYTEAEVNAILQAAYADYVLLRRYLIEYGFLAREDDGSVYWVREHTEGERGATTMDKQKKAELKQNYKLSHRPVGVYQFKNNVSGKILVGSSPNLDGIENRHRFQLKMGMHPNKELQRDWKELGDDQFSFDVLEVIKPHEDGNLDYSEEMSILEEIWLEKLQPYGEKGYNKKK